MAIKSIQSDITKLELKTTWASGIVYCKMYLISGSEDQKNGMIYMVLYGMVWYGMVYIWYVYWFKVYYDFMSKMEIYFHYSLW